MPKSNFRDRLRGDRAFRERVISPRRLCPIGLPIAPRHFASRANRSRHDRTKYPYPQHPLSGIL